MLQDVTKTMQYKDYFECCSIGYNMLQDVTKTMQYKDYFECCSKVLFFSKGGDKLL